MYLSHILHPQLIFQRVSVPRAMKINVLQGSPGHLCWVVQEVCATSCPASLSGRRNGRYSTPMPLPPYSPAPFLIWPETCGGVLRPMESGSKLRRWPTDHSQTPAGTWGGWQKTGASRIELCGFLTHRQSEAPRVEPTVSASRFCGLGIKGPLKWGETPLF